MIWSCVESISVCYLLREINFKIRTLYASEIRESHKQSKLYNLVCDDIELAGVDETGVERGKNLAANVKSVTF